MEAEAAELVGEEAAAAAAALADKNREAAAKMKAELEELMKSRADKCAAWFYRFFVLLVVVALVVCVLVKSRAEQCTG